MSSSSYSAASRSLLDAAQLLHLGQAACAKAAATGPGAQEATLTSTAKLILGAKQKHVPVGLERYEVAGAGTTDGR